MTDSATRPRYGVDAPGVIAAFFVFGLGAAGLGFALRSIFTGVIPSAIGAALILLSLAPLGLGCAMTAYAIAGKRRTREWILNRVAWRGDEIVLDVGAGRCFLAVGAARRVPRGRVLAIDIWRAGDLSGNGIDAITANVRAEGVEDRVEIITGDARAMDVATASVDTVVSLLCIHNIEPEAERRRALAEIARVLKPGGVALIADYTATASYARVLRELGLAVNGPINGMREALSLMALVEARKPLAD